MMERCYGLHLGNTCSSIGCMMNEGLVVLDNENGTELISTMIVFDDENILV